MFGVVAEAANQFPPHPWSTELCLRAVSNMKKQVVFGSTIVRRRSTCHNASQQPGAPDNKDLKLHDLDDGVLGLILVHLDVASICSVASTCKDLSAVVFSAPLEHVWRQKLIDSLPYAPVFLPQKAKRGHKWSQVVKHVVESLKGPSDKVRTPVGRPDAYSSIPFPSSRKSRSQPEAPTSTSRLSEGNRCLRS